MKSVGAAARLPDQRSHTATPQSMVMTERDEGRDSVGGCFEKEAFYALLLVVLYVVSRNHSDERDATERQ